MSFLARRVPQQKEQPFHLLWPQAIEAEGLPSSGYAMEQLAFRQEGGREYDRRAGLISFRS